MQRGSDITMGDRQPTHPVVFSVGHSNASLAQFLLLLHAHRIGIVVDVRSYPVSRHAPHFTQQPLVRALGAAGIGYVFMGDRLGGRPRDPACYRDGVVPRGKADYLRLVDYSAVATRSWYRDGVADLVAIARSRRTAIMCSEENPQHCHRFHLVSYSLAQHGLPVLHIRHRGEIEAAPFSVAEVRAEISRTSRVGVDTMTLFTVGFTKKTAKKFFTLLADNGVQRIIDVRLKPNGQLAGFTKRDDLAYFLPRLINCEYHYTALLAPTADILSGYRADHDWNRYVERFEQLMDQRNVPFSLDRAFYEEKACCLLCSEPTPEQCHRRLVAERIARSWAGTEIVHL